MASYFTATNAAIFLGACVAAILLYLLVIFVRNPVLVKIGVRNIPRRPAQSVLIVIGLTLSTIIIMSALSIGDTLTYSVRRHAIRAYGDIDEIIAPPLLSALMAFADDGPNPDESEPTPEEEQLNQLMEGGLTTVLTVLEGGLPSITVERYEQLQAEAEQEPSIDATASSILFPTIIRNTSTGQGEPLGFIFAVDNDYDQQFGLTSIDGQPVEMETLQTGIGNIFAQAANLFALARSGAAGLGLEGFTISDAAVAVAAVGAILTSASEGGGIDLANLEVSLETLRSLGIDTTLLEQGGIDTLSLESLGLDPATLEAIGVTTTTVTLDDAGGGAISNATEAVTGLFSSFNLNTLGMEIDRVLGQYGLQLRQGDVYLNRLGAEQLDARVGDVLEIYIGPIPIPFRVRAVVEEGGPLGSVFPVVLLRLDEAQKLLFMNGKVNNVLVSNLGDEVAGMEHAEAVSERLRVLALDPQAVATAEEILRRPSVRAVIEREAPRVAEQFQEEFEGPPIIADMIRNFGGLAGYEEAMAALPAAIAEGGDALREPLANLEVRMWILEQDIPSEERAALDAAFRRLNQFDVLDPLSKSSVVQIAAVGGAIFSSVFSLFGIFSVIAGVLLIFLIFVMLAAERRSEMGIARAIGVQRAQVVQMFVTEGVLYDLAAAALGVALGLGISYAMVGFIGQLFNTVSNQLIGQSSLFTIYFRAVPTSMVIAYCLGVLFTFLVVTLASWRVSRLNIVTAIRGLDDSAEAARASRFSQALPWAWAILIAGVGVYILIYSELERLALVQLGATLIVTGGALLAGRFLQRTTLRDEVVQRIVYTVIGLTLVLTWALPWGRWLGLGSLALEQDGPWVLVSFGLTGPLVILGAILVVMFNADSWTWAINRLLGGIGALTPVLRTAIAYPLSARFRTGTAMLLFAMIISTVTIMSIVIQATQTLVRPDSERNAGFDIQISPSLLSFFSPVNDLETEIERAVDFPSDDIVAVGQIASVSGEVQEVSDGNAVGEARRATLIGVNPGYVEQAAQVYTLSHRAPGYESDEAVWQALAERDDVAVLTANLYRTDPAQAAREDQLEAELEEAFEDEDEEFGPPDEARTLGRRFFVSGASGSGTLPDIRVTLRSTEDPGNQPQTAAEQTVQIIGVIQQNDTLAGNGIHVNLAMLRTIAGNAANPDSFYLKAREGADLRAVAAAAERSFLASALNATLLAESFAQGQALTRGILQLFQGFLALGLLVGIAGLGVISTRTVVERRQQVGMLRAIGFQPGMVALSFVLESSFIALTGILVGVAAGVVLGQSMVGIFYSSLTGGVAFQTPWVAIGVLVLISYLFSLLTTILPAYQAARIYPAEALRYE